jgi:integrase
MMQRYFVHAYKTRQRSGVRTHYNDLRAFFKREAAESGTPSPMASIPRPRDVVTPATILEGKQFRALLATCAPRRPEEGERATKYTAINAHSIRDKAIILLFAESGMRRMELAALDISDVDCKNRQAVIRSGKGGKPRIVAFGTEAAQALLRWLRIHPLVRDGLDDGPLFCVVGSGKRLQLYSIGDMIARRGEAREAGRTAGGRAAGQVRHGAGVGP